MRSYFFKEVLLESLKQLYQLSRVQAVVLQLMSCIRPLKDAAEGIAHSSAYDMLDLPGASQAGAGGCSVGCDSFIVLPDGPAGGASLTGSGAGASVYQMLCCEAGQSRQLQNMCQATVVEGTSCLDGLELPLANVR